MRPRLAKTAQGSRPGAHFGGRGSEGDGHLCSLGGYGAPNFFWGGIQKIENGKQMDQRRQDRRQDSLKTVPGGDFEKHKKSMKNNMHFSESVELSST